MWGRLAWHMHPVDANHGPGKDRHDSLLFHRCSAAGARASSAGLSPLPRVRRRPPGLEPPRRPATSRCLRCHVRRGRASSHCLRPPPRAAHRSAGHRPHGKRAAGTRGHDAPEAQSARRRGPGGPRGPGGTGQGRCAMGGRRQCGGPARPGGHARLLAQRGRDRVPAGRRAVVLRPCVRPGGEPRAGVRGRHR